MAMAHPPMHISLSNKFALLDESDPLQPPQPSAAPEPYFLASIPNVPEHRANAATMPQESDNLQGHDAWHVQETRKKKPSHNSSPFSEPGPREKQPSDEDDSDDYYDYYDDQEDSQSSFMDGNTGASSPWSIITPTDEHHLSKSARAVNRKNIRLATKHHLKVTEIRTNQKKRADNLESRERRKNPLDISPPPPPAPVPPPSRWYFEG